MLEKFGVEMIGAKAEAIDKAEDRELFREAMKKIGLETPKSMLANASAAKDADKDVLRRRNGTAEGRRRRHRRLRDAMGRPANPSA